MAGDSRILVTGAGGFIGSHLVVDRLARGDHVRALDLDLGRLGHWRDHDRCECIEGDCADPGVIDGAVRDDVGVIHHLAAAHLSLETGEREYWRVNVDGTTALARLARDRGVPAFVHCSTVGVYGRITSPPADEDTPCRPTNVYGRSKLAGERAVLETLSGAEATRLVVLRPAWVYGPGCGRTARLFRAIRRGRFVTAGSGGLRHCVFIHDMLDALDLAATSEAAAGRVLVIGAEEATPIPVLIDQIAEIAGGRPPRRVPLWLLRAIALAAESVFRIVPGEPPLSRRSLGFFTDNTAFDITRARDLLGFAPQYDLCRGLRATWAALDTPDSDPLEVTRVRHLR